jgi:hypothetical protein
VCRDLAEQLVFNIHGEQNSSSRSPGSQENVVRPDTPG